MLNPAGVLDRCRRASQRHTAAPAPVVAQPPGAPSQPSQGRLMALTVTFDSYKEGWPHRSRRQHRRAARPPGQDPSCDFYLRRPACTASATSPAHSPTAAACSNGCSTGRRNGISMRRPRVTSTNSPIPFSPATSRIACSSSRRTAPTPMLPVSTRASTGRISLLTSPTWDSTSPAHTAATSTRQTRFPLHHSRRAHRHHRHRRLPRRATARRHRARRQLRGAEHRRPEGRITG